MTPEPALWNWRSRGFESCGASKNRRKNGSSSSGLRPGCSLMVPRVAMFTTEGETRLTMGASVGMAEVSAAGTAANSGPLIVVAASTAAAILRRRFMRDPSGDLTAGDITRCAARVGKIDGVRRALGPEAQGGKCDAVQSQWNIMWITC